MLDERKVIKAMKGNEKAFEDLIHDEKEKLFRMAYLYVKDKEDALDVVQEAVYKAFVSIKHLQEPHYFSTWITKILIRAALDFIKRNNRLNVVPIEEIERLDYGERNIDDRLDIMTAIECLQNPYKTVIILRYYKDLSIKQIGDVLDCPEGTVKAQLHRAISKLKFHLKRSVSSE
ncbi:sigma-70 family RNA polymerase sigma factor [Priestia koreensis]|uniref:sigma-70 family RNA polymerase sigma factor n=1 Tax=Priestia koreensis TaxID=284581 RepID=UPI001F58E21F|nr:sigma-70 family RNA polymerase sigma factor [Priestia koreensis]UNL83765.1 sigma-70 family RNA polymerase sigma factor [Priestia koreensis]